MLHSFPSPVWVTHEPQSLRDVPVLSWVNHGHSPSGVSLLQHGSPTTMIPQACSSMQVCWLLQANWCQCVDLTFPCSLRAPSRLQAGSHTLRMWESQAIWGERVGNSATQRGQLPSPLGLFRQPLCSWWSIPADRSLPPPVVFLASLSFPLFPVLLLQNKQSVVLVSGCTGGMWLLHGYFWR